MCLINGLMRGQIQKGRSAFSYFSLFRVYQFLLALSVWAPGALRPSHSVPHFDVPQPDLLRCLKVLLAREIEEMSLSSPSSSPSSSSSSSSPFLSIKPPESLLKHQRDTVDDLHQKDELALERDGMPRRSHFFCLPTGAGKCVF